ncbi:hypothetical protein [Burkholderia sp. Bp9012]|uniref:hypothetical protein n=1 Tax=Burkholderia sp. Bp9012 TaxID=2184562 RepID=UPI000F5B6BC7|nr:hypothetical protein [Burkholderia sp. Bp9012]
MSTQWLSYEDVLARYRTLLAANPGKALITSPDTVALFHPDSQDLCWAYCHDGTPCIDIDSCSDFDRSAFYDGHWEGDASAEETLAAISNPRFLDLPARRESTQDS